MDPQNLPEERDPSEPLTFDNYPEFQGDGPCAGRRMSAYLDCIMHYETALERIEQIKDFKEMKKELSAFIKDRHSFRSAVLGTWDRDAKMFIKPAPEFPS